VEVTKQEERTLLTISLDIITRWRKFIIGITFAGTLIALVVSLLLTPKFKSSASVFPPDKSDIFASFTGIPSLVKSVSTARGLLRTDPELDKYTAILKSGRVLGEIIRQFDLVIYYEITKYPMENTSKELLSNVEFSVETEGYLIITVFDKDPIRAADMANAFVDALNRANGELSAQNARATRMFIEERYKRNREELARAEDSLRAFQKKYGIVALPEQTEASIKASAELYAQLVLKEVQYSVMQQTVTPGHPNLEALKIEINELKNKIEQMNTGNVSEVQSKIFVPFQKLPDLAIPYLRKYREVEIQSKILQFIVPLYEQAKVEEQRQAPPVIVLDRAAPAERKSKPKRIFIVLGGFFVSFLGSLGYAGLSEMWEKQRKAKSLTFLSFSNLFNELKTDYRKLRRRR
jgi:uncharacterized protein involved in exopolysaccharide biosynthesis